jgi:hypothetical protein
MTFRWVNDWRGLHLNKVYSDDYPKRGDFDLPDDVFPDDLSKLKQMGPGIKSWFYIKWLFFKYR